jgi:hypothetical protein
MEGVEEFSLAPKVASARAKRELSNRFAEEAVFHGGYLFPCLRIFLDVRSINLRLIAPSLWYS